MLAIQSPIYSPAEVGGRLLSIHPTSLKGGKKLGEGEREKGGGRREIGKERRGRGGGGNLVGEGSNRGGISHLQ